MNILIISQYFSPENFLINDFAQGLRGQNHSVDVLTGLPNYPFGKFYQGYSFKGPYYEEINGIRIWRSPLIPRGNSNSFQLALNYLSFAFFACFRGIFLFNRKYDYILVFEVSPVTVGIPARFIKFISGAKLYFWVQDLWPESLSATGAVKSGRILKCVGMVTSWIYRGCDKILIQSKAFRESILKYGVDNIRISYFPNYVDDYYQIVPVDNCSLEKNLIPEGFCVMFAGNIGVAQDFETILKAAELTLSNPEIKWVILGDGRQREWVEREINNKALTNVYLLGHFPAERMPAFFSHADAMLVSLNDDPIFKMTIPSKIQAYLACGKPIIASIDGEGARIIDEADAGIAVAPGSPHKLAATVFDFAIMDTAKLKRMGISSRKYYEKNFSRAFLLDQFNKWISR